MNKTILKFNMVSFVVLVVGFLMLLLVPNSVFADECEELYGGGERCVFNKRFSIDKKVRIEGDNEWKDKVFDVDINDVIEFRIEIKNTGDIEVDDMSFEDFLPNELEKISGDLTEDWNDFDVGDEKKFTIKARIKKSEFDRSEDFEKCVVNKAVVEFEGDEEGSDTATVCYGDGEIEELPETGATALNALGLGLIAIGALIKKSSK